MPDVVMRSVYRTLVVMDGGFEATRSNIPSIVVEAQRVGIVVETRSETRRVPKLASPLRLAFRCRNLYE